MLIQLHRESIELYGGATALRDYGLLESAVTSPTTNIRRSICTAQSRNGGCPLACPVPKPSVHRRETSDWSAGGDVFLTLIVSTLPISSAQAIEWTLALAKGEMGRERLSELFQQTSSL